MVFKPFAKQQQQQKIYFKIWWNTAQPLATARVLYNQRNSVKSYITWSKQRQKKIREGLHTLTRECVKKASCESTPVASVRAMSTFHWGLGFSESLIHGVCQYSQWDWLSGLVIDTEDNYRVSLRSLLSPCPSNGNTLLSEMPTMTGKEHRLLSEACKHKKTPNNFLSFVSLTPPPLPPPPPLHIFYNNSQISLLNSFSATSNLPFCLQLSVSVGPSHLSSFSGVHISSFHPSLSFVSPVSALPLPLVAFT